MFTATTPFEILWDFIKLALASVALGAIFGITSSLLFKYMRFLTHTAVIETIVIFILGMMCYFLSEMSELSGIISLLTCGVAMAHYTWYNLSPQGKTVSSVAISIFGTASEALVFSYIGLCTFTYANSSTVTSQEEHIWSVSFILWTVLIVIVGRIVATWTTFGMFRCCSKKSDLTLREVGFINYGGTIRGAVAFGLVLKIPEDEPQIFKERGVFITTTLAVVIITTILFGTLMKLV